jgi:hypothetical protein
MNSYINLILDAEGAKTRLRRLFQPAHGPEKNDHLWPLSVVRKKELRRRSVRLRTSELVTACCFSNEG